MSDPPALASASPGSGRRPLAFRRRQLGRLKWLVPLALVALVGLYELGPARWMLASFGVTAHLIADFCVYGTVGPSLAYVLLHLWERWLEEREASETQARVLALTREHVEVSRQLNDDAVQVLFAASTLLHSIKTELPPAAAEQMDATERSLGQAIEQLRNYLLNRPPP